MRSCLFDDVREFGRSWRRVLPIAKVVGAGLLVSACASSQAAYEAPSNVGMAYPGQVAVAAPPKVELEDDGLAVQAPPYVRKRVEPDDPSEPFSPNYGPAPENDAPPRKPVKAAPQRQAQSDLTTTR